MRVLKNILPVLLCWIIQLLPIRGFTQCFSCAVAPPGTIWCDDFEDSIPLREKYFEYNDNKGLFIRMPGVGRNGTAGMRVQFQQGADEAGSLKKSFGRIPGSYFNKHVTNPTQDYQEIYWRMDIRMQPGWTGSPFKLSRAISFVDSTWAEGMMAHIWNGGKTNLLVMDPASGIDTAGKILATRYNDFPHLRWLGNKGGNIEVYDQASSGQWFCVEAHVKLNTPGKKDGLFEFWVNDTLQAGSYNLNWHGNYNNRQDAYMINAVFFENYWNDGAPKTQERYFDNLVISTQRIGCACGK